MWHSNYTMHKVMKQKNGKYHYYNLLINKNIEFCSNV